MTLPMSDGTAAGTAPADLIDRLCDSWCRRHRPESMNTDWGQSLLAYGLLRAARVTGNAAAREYVRRWLTYHCAAGIPVTYFVGSWSPGLLIDEATAEFPELGHALRATADRIVTVINDKAIRNGRGIILHNVDLPHIYIDTIYYTSPVLARCSSLLGRDDWHERAVMQLREHLRILRDPSSGFWIHCEENLSGHRSEGAWARGTGWVGMACAELLTLLPRESPQWAECAATLEDLVARLIPLQTEDGLWRTILDEPSAYVETSASAMFLFAMIRGRRLGALPASVDVPASFCLDGLAAYVDEDGRFVGCSEGTWPGTVQEYLRLETGEWWWGTGAALLALTEDRVWHTEGARQ